MFIGFGIIISTFFLFFALDLKNKDTDNLTVKFISENVLKVLLLIFMVMSFLISAIDFPITVMAWQEIGFLNYFRAIIFIIGSAFLPGLALFNILFPDNTLSKRFKVNSFLIKFTISPLLSFIFIGLFVLILNTIGIVIREIFSLFLLISIIILVVIDLAIQGLRDFEALKIEFIHKKIASHTISKNLLLIIALSLGISLIALGIHDAVHYLITGDSWSALSPVVSIEDPNDNPIFQGKIVRYPIFWCYVSYGLAILSGIPVINVSAIMAPFCFLFVFTIYLLNKAILNKFKEKYAILSTIIISMFSGLMFISPYIYNHAIVSSDIGIVSILIFSGQFFFYYKSFALYLAFITIALYIIANKKIGGFITVEMEKKENIKLLCIAALFLVISYMTYMLPLIPVLIFIIFFTLFSKKENLGKYYFLYFLFLTLIFFFIFDLLTNSFNSFLFSDKFDDFIVWILSTEKTNKFIINFLAYYFFFGMIIIYIVVNRFSYFINKHKFTQKTNRNPQGYLKNFIYNYKTQRNAILILFIFSTFLIIFGFFNLYFKFYIFRFIYIDKHYWLYPISILLDNLIISFGIFGILGIYFSYFCFKKDKQLFLILTSWVILSLLYASIAILLEFFEEILYSNPPQIIRDDIIKYITFWLTRNWYYAIIPLSIFLSIGIIEGIKILKRLKFPTKFDNDIKKSIKFAFLTILIIFSYTNVIIAGINWGRIKGGNVVSDKEAQIIGYIPLYVPENSLILTEEKYSLYHGIETMTTNNITTVEEIFDPNKHYKSYIETVENLSIRYAVLDEKEHLGIDPMISSFLNNFLLKYFFTRTLYQYQTMGIFEYSPIEIKPFYQASIDFMIFKDGSGPSEWGGKWNDLSIGNSKVQVIPIKEDHLKVLQLTSDLGYAAFCREEDDMTYGSIEFWLYSTNTYQNFTYKITQDGNNILKFLIDNNKWQYIDNSGKAKVIPGLGISPKNDTWHHIRIDFESSNSGYEGLEQFKWQVIIDGMAKSDKIDFIDKIEGGWSYHCFQTERCNDYSVYLDAIGFSWDEYYELGYNMNKMIFKV
ncbi:MAG: hypothetical protein ACFFB0_14645 [Promethearchaeota archaeon]